MNKDSCARAGETPAICVKGVHFSYEPGRDILRDIHLDIFRGDFACIVGPNGGGKTTLLKLLTGALKPRAGSIHIFGEPAESRRKALALVPQYLHFDKKFPITVAEVVGMAFLDKDPFGWSSDKKHRAKLVASLEKVGMLELQNAPFSEISGGQRQRALIARALACDPDILLLDEPTANVDPGTCSDLMELFQSFKGDKTCVMVSHDIEYVNELVEEVICVHGHAEIHPTEKLDEPVKTFSGKGTKRIRHDIACNPKEHQHG